MSATQLAYELALRSAQPLLRLVAPFNAKLQRGLEGQARALEELQTWSKAQRSTAPLVWVHAPSVGESLMAQAIVRALRAQMPEAQIAFTHFSPSAERMRVQVGADIATYLPRDTTDQMDAALTALRPSAVAFVRTEIWPSLTQRAERHRIPVLLVNAVLAKDSSRLKPLARAALRPSYQRLNAVGAISAPVAERYQRLGVGMDRIRITGDARFDQVWQRVQALQRDQPLLRRLSDPARTTIAAGSTWGSDESVLLPAFARSAREHPARLILAPHEPTREHLHAAEESARALGLSVARLADVEAGSMPLPSVVLVDRVGVLADLYSIADVAYVGGAFQSSGVHSVVEPAALGVPVLFGTKHENAEEAAALAAAGGAFIVSSATALESEIRKLLDTETRTAAGNAARAFTESQLGAARANAALIVETMRPAD